MVDDESLVRLKVNLTRRNGQFVHRLSEMTGLSKTDCVNRAIALYAFLQEQVFLPDHELVARNPKTGKLRRIEMVEPDEAP